MVLSTNSSVRMRQTRIPKTLNEVELTVLVPVYNSQDTIGQLIDLVVDTMKNKVKRLEIVLVNDGSRDESHEVILLAIKRHPDTIRYIQLARNFGEHSAVMCGLNFITGDCVAIIDDDFQNPPSEILLLVQKMLEGYDVVYSYYEKKRHSWFRNLGSRFNDWIATLLLKKPRGLYLSSFKVMNAFLVRSVIAYQGPYPYIDGIIISSTKKIGTQLCQHQDRKIGKSNYTLKKLVQLWLNMSTGFSIVPLRIASISGIAMSILTVFLIVFFMIVRLNGGVFLRQPIPAGWASTIILMTFFAGLQLTVLGILGEYLGRLFLTVNRLPQFIVRNVYGLDATEDQDNV